MVPAAAQKLNLTGIIVECSSRTWVEGFVNGFAAGKHQLREHSVREDIVEGMKDNKLTSRSVFYVTKSDGGRVVIAMYFPKKKTLFYLK